MKVYFCGCNWFQQLPKLPTICCDFIEIKDIECKFRNIFQTHFLTLFELDESNIVEYEQNELKSVTVNQFERGIVKPEIQNVTSSVTVAEQIETKQEICIKISGFFRGNLCEEKLVRILSESKLCSVTICDKFALFLTTSNRIIKLDLCSDGEYMVLDEFMKIKNNFNEDFIKLLKCSNCLTVAVTNLGFVYNIPNRIINEPLDVRDFSIGQEHCLLLLTNGSVLSFGSGRFGQLGHGDLEDIQTPKPIEALLDIEIVSVSCGYWHSLVLSKEGDVYSWGCNKYGQLGQPLIETSIQPIPSLISFDSNDIYKNAEIIKCGAKHSLVLLEEGTLMGCGWNKYGQLGLGNCMECVRKMTTIFQIPNYQSGVVSLECGPWSSFIIIR